MSTNTPKYQVIGSLVKEYTDREKAELAALIFSTFSDLSKQVDREGDVATLISGGEMDFPYGAISKVDTIRWNAFYKVTFKDTDILLPNNIRVIESHAFEETNITSIRVPDNCQLQDYAFSSCPYLEKVEIPNSVTDIGWDIISSSPRAAVYCSIASHAAQFCGENGYPVKFTDTFESVSVTNLPDVTVYPIGGRVDATGLTLKAVTDSGDEYDVAYGYSIEAHSFSTAGTKTITVTLGNVSAQFDVFVDESLPAYPESEHPYANNTDTTWTYTYPEEASALSILFSEDCHLEEGHDFVYVTNSKGDLIGTYTGSELSGVEVMVFDNSFSIRLTSDNSGTGYGFSIAKIKKPW